MIRRAYRAKFRIGVSFKVVTPNAFRKSTVMGLVHCSICENDSSGPVAGYLSSMTMCGGMGNAQSKLCIRRQ